MRLALGLGVLAVGWWLAFRRTHDLDEVERRLLYRLALLCFWVYALTWWLEWFGVL